MFGREGAAVRGPFLTLRAHVSVVDVSVGCGCGAEVKGSSYEKQPDIVVKCPAGMYIMAGEVRGTCCRYDGHRLAPPPSPQHPPPCAAPRARQRRVPNSLGRAVRRVYPPPPAYLPDTACARTPASRAPPRAPPRTPAQHRLRRVCDAVQVRRVQLSGEQKDH